MSWVDIYTERALSCLRPFPLLPESLWSFISHLQLFQGVFSLLPPPVLPCPASCLPSLSFGPLREATVSLEHRVLRLCLLATRLHRSLSRVFRLISTLSSWVTGLDIPSILLSSSVLLSDPVPAPSLFSCPLPSSLPSPPPFLFSCPFPSSFPSPPSPLFPSFPSLPLLALGSPLHITSSVRRARRC